MPGSHLFNLGLFQKHFLSTSKVTGPAINIGCTRGRGSTTRMLNYCTKKSPDPSLCINQFITIGITGEQKGVTSAPPTSSNPNPPTSSNPNPPTSSNPNPPTSSNPISDSSANFTVLGDGLDGTVYSITRIGETYYVGGSFLTNKSGNITFNNIAMWNDATGVKSWSTLSDPSGVGLTSTVYSIATTENNRLYVGGNFFRAPSTVLQNIGIYDLNPNMFPWYALDGPGSASGVNNNVRTTAYNSTNRCFYFGGAFNTTYTGKIMNYIASTNSNDSMTQITQGDYPNINPLIDSYDQANGLNGKVNQISINNNTNDSRKGFVYICGEFTGTSGGNKDLRYVAYYDIIENKFYGLGSGLNAGNTANAIAVYKNSPNFIYIGGTITGAYSDNIQTYCSNIVKFNHDGNSYNILGTQSGDGVNGKVNTILCHSTGDVYIGGNFTSYINGGTSVDAPYIAKWITFPNPMWSALPITLNGEVFSLLEGPTGEIFIGGAFTKVNTYTAYGIIKYIPPTP